MSVDNVVASWTSAQLIRAVRKRARLPTNTLDWTDADVLVAASEQIWTFAQWALERGGDGRLLTTFDRAVAASIPSPSRPIGEYLLPPLAVGDTINSVTWISPDGTKEVPLALVDLVQQPLVIAPGTTGEPWGYAIIADRIRVYPQPSELGTLRFAYPRRHPELCADTTTTAPTVNSILDATGGYTRFTLASTQPFAVGQYVDLINNQYPYRTIFSDLYVGAANAGTTVDLYIPYSYANTIGVAGMRIVRAGQIPYVQLPLEFRNPLSWQVAGDILNEMGDLSASSAAYGTAGAAMDKALGITTRRVKATRTKIINRHSLARSAMRRPMGTDRFP